MSEGDEFPVPPDAASSPDERGDGLGCPDCDFTTKGKIPAAELGLHRWRVHGVKGSGKTAGKRRKRKGHEPREKAEPRQPGPTAILRSVQKSLEDSAVKLGALTYPVMPIPSLYLTETAGDFAETVTNLASRNPKLLARLQGTSDAMDYLALGTWVAGLAVAVGVQVGRIPVGSSDGPNPLVAAWGIDKMYAQAVVDFGAEDQGERGGTGSGGAVDLGNGEGSPSPAMVPGPS